MPLTRVQQRLLADLTQDRSADRQLAGGAAMHITPNALRYSNGLDFFHDSEARVASTFAAAGSVQPHWGTPGGVLPQVADASGSPRPSAR